MSRGRCSVSGGFMCVWRDDSCIINSDGKVYYGYPAWIARAPLLALIGRECLLWSRGNTEEAGSLRTTRCSTSGRECGWLIHLDTADVRDKVLHSKLSSLKLLVLKKRFMFKYCCSLKGMGCQESAWRIFGRLVECKTVLIACARARQHERRQNRQISGEKGLGHA